MKTGLSRPKHQIRWLLLEGISPTAPALLDQAGYTNVTQLKTALDREALIEALQGVHIVGIRSRTQIDEAILKEAGTLVAVVVSPWEPTRSISSAATVAASRSSTRRFPTPAAWPN